MTFFSETFIIPANPKNPYGFSKIQFTLSRTFPATKHLQKPKGFLQKPCDFVENPFKPRADDDDDDDDDDDF